MTADDRAVGPAERLHPLFVLVALGGALRGVAGGYAFIAYLAASGRMRTAVLAGLALLVMLVASLLLYWARFSFRVGDNEIRIDSGILSRTHRSIPFDRVQDVDITQGPVSRLLGLAKVKFETGGSAGSEDEGVLEAIGLARAQELRTLVRSRRSAALADAPADLQSAPVFAMDGRRLLLAGVFNFSLAVFAGLFGATQTFGDVLGFDPLSRRFWAALLDPSNPVAQFVLANQFVSVLAGAALLLLMGLATGLTRTVLTDYGFRLDRAGVGLRRRRGLLTRTDVTLPVARAQAAIVSTGPVRDALGWRDLKLQSLARDEGGGGDHVLAPLARDDEIARILTEFQWSPLPDRVEWHGVSRAYVGMLALLLVPLLVVGSIESLLMPWVALIWFPALLAILALRWLAWRRTGYRLDGDRLLIRSGWWRRRILILPRNRIQSLEIAENLISRRFGVARVQFGVAGGSGFSSHVIPALPRETARALREELLVSPS